jgi:hypothetical protein
MYKAIASYSGMMDTYDLLVGTSCLPGSFGKVPKHPEDPTDSMQADAGNIAQWEEIECPHVRKPIGSFCIQSLNHRPLTYPSGIAQCHSRIRILHASATKVTPGTLRQQRPP